MDKLQEINEDYEIKMAGFEVDCHDGKGEPVACHHVGEFYSVVKDEHVSASPFYLLSVLCSLEYLLFLKGSSCSSIFKELP